MLDKIDMYLLSKFQRISDWSQDNFGLNNFAIARIFIVLMSLFYIFDLYFCYYVHPNVIGWLNLGLFPVYITIINAVFSATENISNQNSLFKNIQENSIQPTRIIMIIILLPMSIIALRINSYELFFVNLDNALCLVNYREICSSICSILFVIYIYFGCCTPKPPKKSRLKKAIEKISEKLEELINQEPVFSAMN